MIWTGAFRRVIAVGRFAVKFPRFRRFAQGMRCNRWEREIWRTWRLAFDWYGLCPIRAADPWGFVVIMDRARQPVTQAEIEAAFPGDQWPDIDVEYGKPANFGRLRGAIVALDYGLWDEEDVQHRRSYLADHPRRRLC